MSKKSNVEAVTTTECQEENVEDYTNCVTHKQKCLTDCWGGDPLLSHLS